MASRRAAKPVTARSRRALSNVGGPVELTGEDTVERASVESALRVDPDERATMAHVHGFHTYPARMHPGTARSLVGALTRPGDVVLDPFAGSGTVLVEARLLGRRAFGSDANPLAVLLATLKTRGADEDARRELLETAHAVADFAEERRKGRAGPIVQWGPEERNAYDVHVLLELDGLRGGILEHARGSTRDALLLVLSSMLVKVSRKTADTGEDRAAKRIASGFTIRFFVKKTEELARRLAEFTNQLPAKAPPARVVLADARALGYVTPASVSLVVTSPPYPGTYDYADQHALRARWLGLDLRPFARREMGARRRLARIPPDEAVGEWRRDLSKLLGELCRTLAPRGRIAILIADSVIGRRPVRADELVRSLAPRAGLEVTTVGSQVRRHFHVATAQAFGKAGRREHLVVLGRMEREASRPAGPRPR